MDHTSWLENMCHPLGRTGGTEVTRVLSLSSGPESAAHFNHLMTLCTAKSYFLHAAKKYTPLTDTNSTKTQ